MEPIIVPYRRIMSLSAGAHLGPYEIVGLVGAGGMGEVYKAVDPRLNRTVAIKVPTEQLPERFRREAQAIAALNHPNICQIYDVGPDYLVMEFVDGAPIRPVNSVTALLDRALQITGALIAAHGAGMVHRDLKPANILLTPDGQIKLLDFGLARSVHPPAARVDRTRTAAADLTTPGMTVGTLAYMSPEQARGEPIDARSDLWSLGVILYELATGQRPFAGATPAVTIDALLNKAPAPVRERNPKMPPEIERIISRLLEKDRETRYQSAADLRADLRRVERDSGSGPAAVTPEPRRRYRVMAVALVSLAAVVASIGLWFGYGTTRPPTSPSEYVQITNFVDSATAPSLSPDGRMVTFIRGGDWFLSQGQIYLKLLPNGESKPLTNTPERKYGPVFSPDGSRVAYTIVSSGSWDTWTIPVLGGEATRLLPNASGLTWTGDQRVLFSEIKSGLHMGIVAARENRSESHEIYLPAHERAMAHFSYASPDRSRTLIVEMDRRQIWQRCRLVPFDGSTTGSPVGPQGDCMAAGWSPDGRVMYFSAKVNGQSHLWRQRLGDTSAEQITFGPTEEEGVAVAADGNSLVTSVGTRQSAVWLHDASGERQLSPEGFASLPWLSPDGRHAYYALRQNPQSPDVDVCMTETSTGKTDRVLPGVPVVDFDVSRDERLIAYTTQRDGESQIWLASLDRRSAPRQIATSGDHVSFASNGQLVFRALEQHVNHLYRVQQDGTKRQQILASPILAKFAVSPDGRWATAAVTDRDDVVQIVAVPIEGGSPLTLCEGRCAPRWSWDQRFLYLMFGDTTVGFPEVWETIAIPLPSNAPVPNRPIRTTTPDTIRGDYPAAVVVSQQGTIFPGTDTSTFVVAKGDLRRNLFRIPVH